MLSGIRPACFMPHSFYFINCPCLGLVYFKEIVYLPSSWLLTSQILIFNDNNEFPKQIIIYYLKEIDRKKFL